MLSELLSMGPGVRILKAGRRGLELHTMAVGAGYERLAVRRSACQLAGELRPESLVAQARDWLGSAGLGWLGGGIQILRRYPALLSLLTSVVSNRQRRGIALKTALIAGLVWLGKRRGREPDA